MIANVWVERKPAPLPLAENQVARISCTTESSRNGIDINGSYDYKIYY